MTKQIDFDGIVARYDVRGSGIPIVLVHGYCSDRKIWDELALELEKDFLVIIPDLMGYGETPLSNSELSMELYANLIKQILKLEQIEKCYYVGHSMGGYIGLEFLEKNAKMLTGFTLLNSHCFTDSDEKTTNREKTIRFLEKHGSKIYVQEIFKTLFGVKYFNSNISTIDEIKQRALRYSVQALVESCKAMIARKNHTETLQKTTVPIQFILGKEDALIPIPDFLIQASFPNFSSVHIVEKMGHMGMLEQNEKTLTHLKRFILKTNY